MNKISVLLVEDEALIRMMLTDMLEELGHRISAEASNVVDALKLAETADYDLAVLDINVAGASIEPVAVKVAARNLPFIFISGYGAGGVPTQFQGTPALPKPFATGRLKEIIEGVVTR